MSKLESTWDVKCGKNEPHTIIKVSGLRTILPAVTDAWGRHPASQPALISCSVSLSEPFITASTEDVINNSTVHYGILSKAILEACDLYSRVNSKNSMQLNHILYYIQYWLTGTNILNEPNLEISTKPMLSSMSLETIEIELLLPKASLLGSGVKLNGIFRYEEKSTAIVMYSMMLEICDLRIPTLIGVNPNETISKQIVIVSVQIDYFEHDLREQFHELEKIIVKSVEESSFRTLEALGKDIGQKIVRFYLYPQILASNEICVLPTIRIKLSKPTAVTLADASTVEMLIEPDKFH